MPFNSIPFLVFFSVLVLFFYIVPRRFRFGILLTFSLFYFSTFGYVSILSLVTISAIGFFFLGFAKPLLHTGSGRGLAALTIVLVWLGFKYLPGALFPFFFAWFPGTDLSGLLLHPLGISFYSLQLISMIFDFRARDSRDSVRFRDVLLFLSFLPQSMAGPIHRKKELLPQLKNMTSPFLVNDLFIGVKYLLLGFFCKLVVGDKLAILVRLLLDSSDQSNGLALLVGAGLYSFQIYFDFYGYSLIAIGLGRTLGIRVKINFRKPYSSLTFREFWKRWHISLSTWFRDYLYIPLGGNRRGYLLWALVVFLTFLASGIWHGSGVNFLIWGAIHGLLLILETSFTNSFSRSRFTSVNRLFKPFWRLSFFVILSLTWLVFRTEDLNVLEHLLKKILELSSWSFLELINFLGQPVYLFYLGLVVSILIIEQSDKLDGWLEALPSTVSGYGFHVMCLTVLGILLILFGDLGSQEFLYFRF